MECSLTGTIENFKPTALKVITVTYDRCSLTRGSDYSDFTCKILVFWISGLLQEVVTYKKSWHREVQLYFDIFIQICRLGSERP